MLELTVAKSTLITPLQPQPLNSVSSTGTMYISVLCGWYPAHTEWLACSMIHSNFQQNYIHTHVHTYIHTHNLVTTKHFPHMYVHTVCRENKAGRMLGEKDKHISHPTRPMYTRTHL